MHSFKAKWQQLQLKHLKATISPCHFLLEQGFSEGYTMISDKAAQSTYWSDKTMNLNQSVCDRDIGKNSSTSSQTRRLKSLSATRMIHASQDVVGKLNIFL